MINSVLRHTATLHKQHGMTADGDSTESGALTDLLSKHFVPASMKLIQVTLNTILPVMHSFREWRSHWSL
jgi:hypothetical protein